MERLLPQNVEAEAGVLGSLLIDPEAIANVTSFLRAEDFYRDGHRLIYEAVAALYDRHEPADFVMVCHELERHNKLEEAGGEDYVISLINQVPTSGNAEYYARIIEQMALLRRLIHAGSQIVATAYGEENAEAALEQAEQTLFAVRQGYAHKRAQSYHIADVITNYMERLSSLSERQGALVGVPTGFSDLDRILGGLQRSDLIILAARPAVGKTSFALSLAYNTALQSKSIVGIFSLEMSSEQLVQRLISMDAQIDQQRLRTGDLYDEDWNVLETSMASLSSASILIDDTAGISVSQLGSKARQWMSEYGGLDLLIVDYLQLMQPPASERRAENRVQVVDEMSRQLKVLARELNIPIIALSQLSRAVESRQSKVPMLSDLRESGGLEQNADVVLFIYRDEVYNPNTERPGLADIIISKHRNGPTGEVCLLFNRSQTRFQDFDVRTRTPLPSSDTQSDYMLMESDED